MTVAALFCRKDSVYRSLGCDVYDIDRDARTFDLAKPVVAHPPCRAWGNFRRQAKPRPDEKDLARWAMHVVRHCGGVLEHPIGSGLWEEFGCLAYGLRDQFGGVLVPLMQSWYGHPAPKATALYVVGPVPELRSDGPAPTHVLTNVKGRRRGAPGYRPEVTRSWRERTPLELARVLVAAAGRCGQ